MIALTAIVTVMSTGCSKDDPKNENGGHGTLNGNLIGIGGTRDVDYTSAILLGVVDFPKMTSDHSYGIVYMPAMLQADFDYDSKLVLNGSSGRYDKEKYTCTTAQVMSSTSDGKFEKQLVNLKPATKYYYRAYVAIGSIVNYSNVESFSTQDPSPDIKLITNDATDVQAVASVMNGNVNVGLVMDTKENQKFGFIYTDAVQMSTPDKLSFEYYDQWQNNHLETEEEFDKPKEVTTTDNLNGRINVKIDELIPGRTYYYRSFFCWNGKYFYSPEVKSFTTKSTSEITVRVDKIEDVTSSSVSLKGNMPFSLIGMQSVTCGFMISTKYNSLSEFNYDTAVEWGDRYSYPDADVYYVETTAYDTDFSYFVNGLQSDTPYNVCAFVYLGSYDEIVNGMKKDVSIVSYSPIQSFRTEKSGSGSGSDNIAFSSTGTYPWTLYGDVWTSGGSNRDNATSYLYASVKHSAGQTFSCTVAVSSESGCDKLLILIGGTQMAEYSGYQTDTFTYKFNTNGTTNIEFRYTKDGSVNDGQDCAQVSNWSLR